MSGDFGPGEMDILLPGWRDRISELVRVRAERDRLLAERVAIQESERALTCVFCGHVYPPGTPASNHEALRAHVATCPDHPAAAFKREAERLAGLLEKARRALAVWIDGYDFHAEEVRDDDSWIECPGDDTCQCLAAALVNEVMAGWKRPEEDMERDWLRAELP